MRKFIVTLMASLLSCSTVFAFWPEAADSSLEIGVGYRQDKIEWKTSANANGYYGSDYADDYGLGVSSHLKWRDLQIWQIEAGGKYITCDNIYLRACGDYGWITHGKNTDSDSLTLGTGYDESSDEFAHSKSRARGHVYDAKLAIGYQFKMCDDGFSIAPLVGYSWHGQHLKDRHLKQKFYVDDATITISDPAYSSYGYGYGNNRNHSSYHTRWDGPFVGFDFDYQFGCGCEMDWQVFGGYEFHWATYHAKGNWNLREDLIDGFHHRAKNAYGNTFNVGVKWDFCECWSLAVKGEFQWWHAKRGHDRSKVFEASLGDIETNCFVKIPLRDIKWQSAGVSVDLGMVF